MALLVRALAALLVVAVLVDASACSPTRVLAERSDGVVRVSAICPCGCHTHTGSSLAGIGLSQPAALPAEASLPSPTRARPVRAPLVFPAAAPVRALDHVPIASA